MKGRLLGPLLVVALIGAAHCQKVHVHAVGDGTPGKPAKAGTVAANAAKAKARSAAGPRYSVTWKKLANAAVQDLAVDWKRGDVWALGGKPSKAKCTTGDTCGYNLMKFNPKAKKFVSLASNRGCGKRLTVMPSTGKPWVLSNCNDVIGWTADNKLLSSPASLAQENTFRDITARQSTVYLLDGNIDNYPVPPFTSIDTAANTLQKFSISGLAYAFSAVFGVTDNTQRLLELTATALGSLAGGQGDWYIPFPQTEQMLQKMKGWGKPAGGKRSKPVFLDVALDPTEGIWFTGGVLGSSNADSSAAVWFWDQANERFERVFYRPGVVPGRLSFGPDNTVYMTAGTWSYKGSNIMADCGLDNKGPETVHAYGGPMAKCFTPTSLWVGTFKDKRPPAPAPAAAPAGSKDKAPAASVGFPGTPVGEPVANYLTQA